MKGLAICAEGIEDISASEIKELIKAKTEQKRGCVVITPKKVEDLFLLCYKAQSVDQILIELAETTFKNKGELLKNLEKECKNNLKQWFKGNTFKVACIKRNNELPSEELAADIGGIIIKEANPKVDLNNPDITCIAYINQNQCYLGISLSKKELNKRDYKIFPNAHSLKGTLAYAITRIANAKKSDAIVDPFSFSGEVPIEAALWSTNFPVNYYDKQRCINEKIPTIDQQVIKKLIEKAEKEITIPKKPSIFCFDPNDPNINAAKKNAKIAGINKAIQFSRMNIDWLDTRLEKASIDKIITYPPEPSAKTNKKEIEKLYNEFFYQADFILKKKGTITIIQRLPKLIKTIAKEKKFNIKEERTIFAGKEPLQIVIFSKT